MPNYCILRNEKLKSSSSVKSAIKEMLPDDNSERNSPRADISESFLNTNSDTASNAYELYKKLLPEKIRKNAVVGCMQVVTTSEEFSNPETEEKFYDAARQFIAKNFGTIVAWSIHRDETSTHMQCITIPLVDGQLNARQLIGGTKNRMTEIQDDFYTEVGKSYGLARGQQNSKARHKTVEELHKAEQVEIDQKKKEQSEKETRIKIRERELEKERNALTLMSEFRRNEIDKKIQKLEAREESLQHRESDFNARFGYFDNNKNLWKNVEQGLDDEFEKFKKCINKKTVEQLKKNCINLFTRLKNIIIDVKERLRKYEEKPIQEVIDELEKAKKNGFKTYGEFIQNQSNSNANTNSNIQKKSKLGRH